MKTDLATELILHGTAQYPTSYSSAELRTVVTVPGWLLVLAHFQGPLVRQLLATAQLVLVVKRNEGLPMDCVSDCVSRVADWGKHKNSDCFEATTRRPPQRSIGLGTPRTLCTNPCATGLAALKL